MRANDISAFCSCRPMQATPSVANDWCSLLPARLGRGSLALKAVALRVPVKAFLVFSRSSVLVCELYTASRGLFTLQYQRCVSLGRRFCFLWVLYFSDVFVLNIINTYRAASCFVFFVQVFTCPKFAFKFDQHQRNRLFLSLEDGDERDGAEGQEGDGCRGQGGAADQHGHAVLANAAAAACGEFVGAGYIRVWPSRSRTPTKDDRRPACLAPSRPLLT